MTEPLTDKQLAATAKKLRQWVMTGHSRQTFFDALKLSESEQERVMRAAYGLGKR